MIGLGFSLAAVVALVDLWLHLFDARGGVQGARDRDRAECEMRATNAEFWGRG